MPRAAAQLGAHLVSNRHGPRRAGWQRTRGPCKGGRPVAECKYTAPRIVTLELVAGVTPANGLPAACCPCKAGSTRAQRHRPREQQRPQRCCPA
eukprot:2018964-Lingulodinium_polyedra.AAC.1